MRYENMPKGRNKDICVRCGKRANFADKLKSDVQYDLLCLAETTSSGYKTHGNVKLCGKCMSELLMWLDRKTENCSEKPNNCEHITEDGVTCAKYPACDDCLDNPLNKVKGSERLVKGSEQTEPTISKMEQVEDEPLKTTDYCDICKRDMCELCVADATNPYCVPSHYEINYEPKDEPITQTKTQNSNLTFEKADEFKQFDREALILLIECQRERIAELLAKDEPQTDCAWK